jgi:hypothetical protein
MERFDAMLIGSSFDIAARIAANQEAKKSPLRERA